jgi:mono/diheme cytochrome c family protein
MSTHNPELQPPAHVPPNSAIQPNAPDFVETPDKTPGLGEHEPFPTWLYVVCLIAIFLAGSSFTGFSTFGMGLMDQGPGAPTLVSSGPKEVAETPLTLGKKVYNSNCANCHQTSGEGQPGTYPPLGGSEWVVGNKERLAAILLHGLAGQVSVRGATYSASVMPAWDTALTDEKIADVMTYMRASWGNTQNAATPEEVSAARAKFASHSGPWSEAELLKIAPNGPDPSEAKK